MIKTKTALDRICGYCEQKIKQGEKIIEVNDVWICAKHQVFYQTYTYSSSTIDRQK